jgi:GDP-L-fucose synthase
MEKTILVTGSNGFVGKNLIEELTSRGYNKILSPSKSDLDLTNQKEVEDYFIKNKPNIVLHLAGKVGGIGINKTKPAEFFYDNALMGINVTHFSFKYGVEKLVSLAAGCGYPKILPLPFKEDDFWMGLPDENSMGYSMAKKNLIIQSWAYKEQYGFNSTVLLPANLYGPHDNFNEETSHVIPALIKKFIRAKRENKDEVVIWGSGSATREFLYVKDTVKAIIDAINVNEVGPFNLGTGVETSIKNLVIIISNIVGYNGKIIWDNNKPDGQPKRFYDMEKFKDTFGYVPNTSLEDGIRLTIDWYINNY